MNFIQITKYTLNETFRLAVSQGDAKQVVALIHLGIDINAPDRDGRTPLLRCSIYNHKEIAKILLQNGANPDIQDNSGMTPLMRSCYYDYKDVTLLLMEYGASIENIHSNDGLTTIKCAAYKRNIHMVRIVIDEVKRRRVQTDRFTQLITIVPNYVGNNALLHCDTIKHIPLDLRRHISTFITPTEKKWHRSIKMDKNKCPIFISQK